MLLSQSDKFQKNLKKLPASIQRGVAKQLENVAINGLVRCKKLHSTSKDGVMYSCRVTQAYRIILKKQKNEVIAVDVSHRKNVYIDNVNDEDRES